MCVEGEVFGRREASGFGGAVFGSRDAASGDRGDFAGRREFSDAVVVGVSDEEGAVGGKDKRRGLAKASERGRRIAEARFFVARYGGDAVFRGEFAEESGGFGEEEFLVGGDGQASDFGETDLKGEAVFDAAGLASIADDGADLPGGREFSDTEVADIRDEEVVVFIESERARETEGCGESGSVFEALGSRSGDGGDGAIGGDHPDREGGFVGDVEMAFGVFGDVAGGAKAGEESGAIAVFGGGGISGQGGDLAGRGEFSEAVILSVGEDDREVGGKGEIGRFAEGRLLGWAVDPARRTRACEGTDGLGGEVEQAKSVIGGVGDQDPLGSRKDAQRTVEAGRCEVSICKASGFNALACESGDRGVGEGADDVKAGVCKKKGALEEGDPGRFAEADRERGTFESGATAKEGRDKSGEVDLSDALIAVIRDEGVACGGQGESDGRTEGGLRKRAVEESFRSGEGFYAAFEGQAAEAVVACIRDPEAAIRGEKQAIR